MRKSGRISRTGTRGHVARHVQVQITDGSVIQKHGDHGETSDPDMINEELDGYIYYTAITQDQIARSSVSN